MIQSYPAQFQQFPVGSLRLVKQFHETVVP